jgi:cytochrome c-type biogenesis protein CcmH/NrfG
MKNPDPQALLKGLQHFQQGRQLHAAKDFAGAAEAYRKAMVLMPDHPQLLINFGQLAEDVFDWKNAEKIYRHLFKVKPIADLDGKIASALFNQERYEEAIPLFASFVARNPREAMALRLFATTHFRLSRFADALQLAQRAWDAEKHPDAISLLLAILLETGDATALAPLVEEALARYPNDWQVQKLAGEHLLKSGDYARGFRYFPAMRNSNDGTRHYVEGLDVPWWDGEPFHGTLLVGGEQGIGDEILTASMFPALAARGLDNIVVEADPRLLSLFRQACPAITFVARKQRELKSLAESGQPCRKTICGNLFQYICNAPGWKPPAPGWLQADPARVAGFRARYDLLFAGQRRIGISWKSQRVMKSGTRKHVDLQRFQPLLETPGTAFINLQYGAVAEDIASLPDPARIHVDAGVDTMNDMDALFAQVAALDLVITTSNVTAHVAGAMGVPCWVILPRARPVIWYWGYAGSSTPWYPATVLFRNTTDADDWKGLIGTLAERLRA